MTAEHLNTPAYEEFERGTLELHELVRSGREDSQEADRIRDSLQGPWIRMTPEQRNFGNGFSADLYMLNPDDGEVLEPATEEERSPQQLGLAIKRAWDDHDWSAALELLRKGPTFFPSNHIAYLRARAYAELGRLAVALAFIMYARRVAPANPTYKVLEIDYLLAVGRRPDALSLANDYVDETNAKLAIYAAGIIFDSTRNLPDEAARQIWAKLAQLLPRKIGAAVTDAPDSFASGCIILAACLDGLGEVERALMSYQKASEHLQRMEDHGGYAALKAYVADRFGKAFGSQEMKPTAGKPTARNNNALFELASAFTSLVAA